MGWIDPETGDTEPEIIGTLSQIIREDLDLWEDGQVDTDGNFIIITKPNGESLSILLHQGQLEIDGHRRDPACTSRWCSRLDAGAS